MNAAAEHAERLAAPERVVGQGAYSIRLADIDTRLDHISAQLDRVESVTRASDTTIQALFASIKKHPLLSKFLIGG